VGKSVRHGSLAQALRAAALVCVGRTVHKVDVRHSLILAIKCIESLFQLCIFGLVAVFCMFI